MYQIDLTRYLRIKYKFGGRDYPNLDCFGLVMCFYRDELGITLPLDKSICDATSENENLVKEKIKYRQVKEQELCDNKMYIACFYGGGKFRHCGVVIDRKILHTSQNGTAYKSISDCRLRFNAWEIKYYEVVSEGCS